MRETRPEYIPILFLAAFLERQEKNLVKRKVGFLDVLSSAANKPSGQEKFWGGFTLDDRVETGDERKNRIDRVFDMGKTLQSQIDSGRIEARPSDSFLYEIKVSSAIGVLGKLLPHYFDESRFNEWLLTVDFSPSSAEPVSPEKQGVVLPDYLNPNHPNYSPSLAATVDAWLAISSNGNVPGKTVKKAWRIGSTIMLQNMVYLRMQ